MFAPFFMVHNKIASHVDKIIRNKSSSKTSHLIQKHLMELALCNVDQQYCYSYIIHYLLLFKIAQCPYITLKQLALTTCECH